MMRGYALLPSILFMAGCPVGKPNDALVVRIENRLSADPCLRNLNSLRRAYKFARRGSKIDPDRIDIDIQEAGHRGLPAGRFIIEPERNPLLDDSQFFGAAATYRVSTDELDIWSCGMNFGGLRHPPRF